jgi:hypothetical protein
MRHAPGFWFGCLARVRQGLEQHLHLGVALRFGRLELHHPVAGFARPGFAHKGIQQRACYHARPQVVAEGAKGFYIPKRLPF